MYLILTKAKGVRPQSWCTCADSDIHGTLLELVANGYNRDDDIYLLYLTETSSLPISHKLHLTPLTSDIGVHPLNLAQREATESPTPVPNTLPQGLFPAPASEPVSSAPPVSQPVVEDPAPSAGVAAKKPKEEKKKSSTKKKAKTEEISVNGFISKTPANLSYLDRLTPREAEPIEAPVEKKPKAKKTEGCPYHAKNKMAPIRLEPLQQTEVAEEDDE